MSSITSLTPSLLASQHEAAYVQHEMRRIEGIAQEPRTLRQYVDLCQRFNAIQSATCALPIEVLSLIFQHVSPSVDYSDGDEDGPFHLALRLVSSHWYYVVKSTPQLWTCVRSGRQGVNAPLAQYLKLCLDNSGSLLLTIFLNFNTVLSDSRFLVSSTVDDALRRNIYRIKSLRIYDTPIIWLSIIPEMFQLTSLILAVSTSNIPEAAKSTIMDLSKLTRFDTFSLSSPCIYDIHLGPAAVSITRLEFIETPIDICIRVYLACQNLIDFRCHERQTPPRSTVMPEIPTSLLKRESLTLLCWEMLTGDLSHWNDYVLKWTHFPVLESLWWTDSSYPNSNYDATEFFSRLPKSLSQLRFSDLEPLTVDTDSLIGHIRHDCNLSELELPGCNEIFLDNILPKLFKTTDVEGEEIIPFPKLVYILVDTRVEEDTISLSSVVGENLARLLEERKGVMKEFTFRSFNQLDEWEDETWRRLEELETGGLALTIDDPPDDSDSEVI